MAQYGTYSDVVNNPLFAKFVKDKLGLDNVEDVNVLDRNALFYSFKLSIGDLDNNERGIVSNILFGEPNKEIKDYAMERFNKPYEELSDDEKVFIAVGLTTRKQATDDGRRGQNNDGNDDNDQQGKQLEDMKRIRSAFSDSNEQWIRWEKLSALKDMGIVSEDLPQMLEVEKTVDLMLKYEPSLSAEQTKEMTERVTNKILENKELLELTPPSVLASMYNEFKDQVNTEKDEQKRNEAAKKLHLVAERIDNLTEMVAKDKELYFADPTNIADAYKGYNAMFVARFNDLMDIAKNGETDEEKTQASEKLQYQHDSMEILQKRITEYDGVYNLSNVSAEKAEDIDERFDEIRETINGVEISPETAKLVSNFKFLDREYFTLDPEQLQSLKEAFPDKDFSDIKTYDMLNPKETAHLEEKGLMPKAEPQFIDKDGNETDKWSDGAKIIPGSKLDKAILAAKQSVMLQNLGADTEITPEFLQKELDAQLPKTLYTLHIVDSVNQGVAENSDQFTNQEYIDKFIADLGNVEKPMSIGPMSFDAGLDNIVNQTGGYAERLVQRLNRDKDGNKVENPNLKVATKLFEPIQSIDKNAKDRIEMKASGKQGYWKNVGKTFVSAATMSVAMRVVGTAAQSATGLAWAGAGIGSVIGVGLTAYQVVKWNKQRKEAGLGTGFKDFIKDRRMMMTVATTTLGCAATACMAVPGMQPVGLVVGGAAMVVGAANGAITAYKAARASGESKWKSILKAAGVVGASALGALTGMKAADAAIDAYNKYNPDNEIFQHKESVKVSDGTPGEKKTVIDRDALEADSKRYNEEYNISDRVHKGMSHDDYMNAVKDYNKAHPDAPITNPDELLKGAYNSQHGRVYGPGYVAEHGLNPNVVKSVGSLINSDGTINPDAVKAWQGSELWRESGLKNFVQGVNEPVELRPDLYPSRNPESTYSGVNMPTKEINTPGQGPIWDTKIIPNDRPLGFAMMGVSGNVVTKRKTLKERIGSLLDKLIGKDKDDTPPHGSDDIPPQGKDRKPPMENDTPVPDNPPAKKYTSPRTTVLPINEALLTFEYRYIYGAKPNPKQKAIYETLVKAEFNQARNNGETQAKDLKEFLQERAQKFEEQIKQRLGDNEDTPKNRGYIIREARKRMNKNFDSSFDKTGNKTSSIFPTLKHLQESLPPSKTAVDKQKATGRETLR